VGILGAIAKRTDVEGILQLDLLATDFYKDDAFENYLIYNPYNDIRTVQITLHRGTWDIYDAISNGVIFNAVSNTATLTVPAISSLMTVYIPTGSEIFYELNKALVDGVVIDYNTGIEVPNYPPRIKSMAMGDSVAIINSSMLIYCTAEDRESKQLTYEWTVDNEPATGQQTLEWNVPSETGEYRMFY